MCIYSNLVDMNSTLIWTICVLQVKSGFLLEEDVRIVSKQIKDRITQVCYNQCFEEMCFVAFSAFYNYHGV